MSNIFKTEILSHPLVFRKPDLDQSEYLQQFRLAVIDLVRDHYLTKEAYAKNFDQLDSIQKNVSMWKDAYLAIEHRSKVLSRQKEKLQADQPSGNFHKLMNPYITDLKNKYQDEIEYIENKAGANKPKIS